ncbi:Lcl C-terminal domain-containing protein [Treponema sp. R80B11-R83G3]
MKKIFAVLAIFALVLAGCEEEAEDTGEIGGKGLGGGTIFFAEGGQYKECSGELGNSSWNAAMSTASNYRGGGFSDWHLPDRMELDLMYKNLKQKGKGGFSDDDYWSSDVNGSSNAYYQDFYSGGQHFNSKSYAKSVRAVRSYTKSGSGTTGNTTLKINNQSFTEITDVIWNSVTFSNNQYENSIKTGTNVTNTVEGGAGYIFFKRKSNPITARTRDLIIVENNQKIEFTFTDNTVIVEVNNPNNNGTLGSVQSTVLWFDDAEGEIQPYYLKQSIVEYYSGAGSGTSSDNYSYFFAPKNGAKSIRIGGTNTALLHLKINLTKRAKLSFWYANKYYSAAGTAFTINGVEKAIWTTNIDWSFGEFVLESGINDIIWAKKDGNGNSRNYYLSLDDILIYYTE